MTMEWNHPSIQEAMIDYERAALEYAESEERLKTSRRKLIAMINFPDSLFGRELDGYILCWQRIMLETRSNDAAP